MGLRAPGLGEETEEMETWKKLMAIICNGSVLSHLCIECMRTKSFV